MRKGSGIGDSKYCLLTILSYTDYSHLVNHRILSRLNKRFSAMSRDRDHGCLRMLPKSRQIFKVDSPTKVRKLAHVNLMHFIFGLIVDL